MQRITEPLAAGFEKASEITARRQSDRASIRYWREGGLREFNYRASVTGREFIDTSITLMLNGSPFISQ